MKKPSFKTIFAIKSPVEFRSSALLILLLLAFFLVNHYVMSYSDPNHWILRAVRLGNGDPMLRRVLLFPAYLWVLLKTIGTEYIFLANLPWMLLLGFISGKLTALAIRNEGESRHISPWGIAVGSFVAGSFLLMPFGQPNFTDRVVRMINPYRDAGAFAVMATGFYVYFRSEKRFSLLLGGLAGLLFGVAMSFRESAPLACAGVGVLVLGHLKKEVRSKKVWRWCVMLILGGVVGITPILIQNVLYSGYLFVPAYSARLIVQEEGTTEEDLHDHTKKPKEKERQLTYEETQLSFRLDRLIPGIHFDRFGHNFPKALNLLYRNFGWQGMVLALAGTVLAFFRKNRILLGGVLPGCLVTLLFYSCYGSVKWRYMFGVLSLSLPLMGYGAFALYTAGFWLIRGKPGFVRWYPKVVTGMLWFWFTFFVISYSKQQPREMKVWDIREFRQIVQKELEEPRTFLGFYHHREMLAWLVDEGFNRKPLGTEISRTTLEQKGLDAALSEISSSFVGSDSPMNFYLFGNQHLPVLSPLWMETHRVFDFDTLPVKPTRYHEELNDILYELRPWVNRKSELQIPVPNSDQRFALFMNLQRMWDYPNRTFARLNVQGNVLAEKLENGPQFFELPINLTRQGDLKISAESDAPLPHEIRASLWTLNSEWYMPLGFNPNGWYHTFLSEDLKDTAPLRQSSCMLWNKGQIRVPTFADQQHRVFAEVRMEFFQDDPLFRDQEHWIHINDVSVRLPGRRQQRRVTVPLGVGKDHLVESLLSFTTTLPSPEQQRELAVQEKIGKWSYVKLFDVRVYALPWNPGEAVDFRAGGKNSGAYIQSGYHSIENHLGRYPVRWTNGQGVLRVPLLSSTHERMVRLIYFAPKHLDHIPQVIFEGTTLNNIGVEEGNDGMMIAHFLLPIGLVSGEKDMQRVEVISPEWKPAELLDSPDQRTLGIMLHQFEISGF